MSKGCIFCKLLEHVRCGLVEDFEFTITVQGTWKWSTVTAATDGGRDTSSTCYFRVYKSLGPANSPGLANSPSNPDLGLDELDTPEQTAKMFSAGSDLSQQGSTIAQRLAQDCQALRASIDDCITSHPDCQQGEGQELPSMLIHVSGIPMSPSVRLVKVPNNKADRIQYVCLSYCWGGPQPGMTTTSCLNSYLTEIDTAVIPETVLDAIRVTITMGYQYLWVDAFCIVQDSGASKIAEMGRMASIYSGAICTICVMSAKSATEGFLQETYPDQSISQSVRSRYADIRDATSQEVTAILEVRSDYSDQDIWDSPILERAWTFQEALLSPRLVMFFASGQRPALRCATQNIQSDGGKVVTHPKPLVSLWELQKAITQKDDYRQMLDKAAEEWVTVVTQYSRRSLTCLTDKMPALTGIVADWETRFKQGKYWAGLWSLTLSRDLMWRVPEHSSPRLACKPYIAPSWSWASRDHPVWYQSLSDFNGKIAENGSIDVVSCEIVPEHEDLPNGAIKSAKLTLKCIAELIDLGDPRSQDASYKVSSGPIKFVFDDSPRPEHIRKAWLLYINDEEPYNNPHGVGIAISESGISDDNGTKLYKRIGRFICSGSGLKGSRMEFTII
ncbi:hypothetical protein ACHAPA_010501 [Fusarium lateritium]